MEPDPVSPPPHFVIDGTVDGWDPATRVLRLALGGPHLVLAPAVTESVPPKGGRVTVSGHVDEDGRWNVTKLQRRSSVPEGPARSSVVFGA